MKSEKIENFIEIEIKAKHKPIPIKVIPKMSKVQVESLIPTNKELISEMKIQHSNLKLQTNRYKFTEKIIDLLSDFAKMHQHEGSKDYKESWQNWIADPEISRELEEEKCRLIKQGMIGDVLDKLYKSSRYYYRKKINKNEEQPKERKKYEGLTKEILHKMDAHIIREINGSIDLLEDDKLVSRFTPSKSFEMYLEENPNIIEELIPNMSTTAEERRIQTTCAIQRIKKTYKNRFYKIKVSLETKVAAA
jgi:hypothetical protein